MYPFDLKNNIPHGYPVLSSEPDFNPITDLQLEIPRKITSLQEIGYSKEYLKELSTQFAFSSPARILSDEGVEKLYQVLKLLEPYAKSSERIPRMVRGGVYQSKYLRELSLSKDITKFFSEIADIELQPHTIPHQLGHINYNPLERGINTDKWHTDTLRYDYVLFVTDPNKVKGGEFEYFLGTKNEMEDLHKKNRELEINRFGTAALPFYVVLSPDNKVLATFPGMDPNKENFINYLMYKNGCGRVKSLEKIWN